MPKPRLLSAPLVPAPLAVVPVTSAPVNAGTSANLPTHSTAITAALPRRGWRAAVIAAAAVAALTIGGAAAPAEAANASPYEVIYSGHPNKPVQWLACRPIDYRINTVSMPGTLIPVIKRVFATIHKQTGVIFHYAGKTPHRYGSSLHSHTTPTIYVTFTRKHNAHGTTLSRYGHWGVGSVYTAYGWDKTRRRWQASATYGDLALYAPLHIPRYGKGQTWQSIITHEVGHTLNLQHRATPGQVMYPYVLPRTSRVTFAPAERRDLNRVFMRHGCSYSAFSHMP
jgi:hypothetical protein